MMFEDEFWGWCDLSSPGLCLGVSLSTTTLTAVSFLAG